MRPGCAHAVHVDLENRHFIVEYNADDEVLRIKERKARLFGGSHVVSWWVPTSHPLGTGNTLPKRVIAAAKTKKAAEDCNVNATP